MTHEDESHGPEGYWGRAGAGILYTTGKRVLLCLRSGDVLEPGTWGIPGGAVRPSLLGDPKGPRITAETESEEELGGCIPGAQTVTTVQYRDRGFVYTTFVDRVSVAAAHRFEPVLNWESDDARWFDAVEVESLDLHFGVRYALDHLDPHLLFGARTLDRAPVRASRNRR